MHIDKNIFEGSKMADEIRSFLSDERFKNYVTLLVALKFTKNGLKDYVKDKINGLYVHLSRRCAEHLPCSMNCVNIHGNNVIQWCDTCKKWRDEFKRFMRYPGYINKINWELFDSRSWGWDSTEATLNQITNVFIRNCRNPTESGLDDIINIISLFNNCLFFDIGENNQLIQEVRRVRNEDFAHTTSFLVEEPDLQRCLDTLLDCLRHRTVRVNIRCKKALETLEVLKNQETRLRCELVSYLLMEFYNLPGNVELNDMIRNKSEEYIAAETSTEESKAIYPYLLTLIPVVILVIAIVLQMQFTEIGNIPRLSKSTDCITMDFTFPWNSDIDFGYYIKEHRDFVGREWLIGDISHYLLNTDQRGLLLTADMGFGKSAIVSSIVCANNERSPGHSIYTKVASLHLCKYNSQRTLEQGLFVRNMAGGIAQKLPEFGNIIQLDNMAKTYLFSNKCIEDPKGCFDFGVLSPLQKVRNVPERLIIIVDALDECSEGGYDNIFSLLYEKVSRLPSYIKLLFTSRNIAKISENLPPGIKIYENQRLKEKNFEDIKRFIKLRLQNATVRRKFGEILSDYNFEKQIEKLAGKVYGNFLFLIHALNYWIKVGDLNEIPDTLEHTYQLNLERVFGKSRDAFEKALSIFEILCASLNKVTEKELFLFLNITEQEEKNNILLMFDDELSHFLTKDAESGTIGFSHKRLSEFLSREDNKRKKFFTSKKHGHYTIASYWINRLKSSNLDNPEVDILTLFYHVANAREDCIKKMFVDTLLLYLGNTSSINGFTQNILHKAVARFNSYDTVKFIIDSLPQVDINKADSGDSSPSYVSAMYGNEQSLKSLLDHYANVSFVRPNFQSDQMSSDLDIINICKYKTHCSYNLLNVASQNGHEAVVRILLQNNVDVLHENAAGLNSFHLAAEHGHLGILNILLYDYSNVLKSSFNTSLYLAAKNGHVPVVEYLLSLGAVDNCLPCNGSLYWVSKGTKRLQSKGTAEIFDDDEGQYILKDDQQLLFCETALEKATQNGHLEVVKVLMNQHSNTISCADARGRTPIFTAVAYDRKDILLYFWKLGLKFDSKCSTSIINQIEHKTGAFEKKTFISKQCSNGLHFAHMLALYSSFETVLSLLKEKYRMPVVTDAVGATPMHYASCSGIDTSINLILEKLNMCYTDKTLNGSTPGHSAAICKNFIVLGSMFEDQKALVSSALDYEKKNVLHYYALNCEILTREMKFNNPYFSGGRIDFIVGSKFLYNKLMKQRDSDGRIPLHYAAMTGNYSILRSRAYKLDPVVYQLRDNYGLTVLDTIFEHMTKTGPIGNIYVTDISWNCDLLHLFSLPECKGTLILLMDSYEYFAYEIFSDLDKTKILKQKDIFMYMEIAVKKNRLYMLSLLKHFYPKYYTLAIINNSSYFFELITDVHVQPSPLLCPILLNELLTFSCARKINTVYIKHILLDKERMFWPLFTRLETKRTIYGLNMTFSNLIKSCAQDDMLPIASRSGSVTIFRNSGLIPFFEITDVLETVPIFAFKVFQFRWQTEYFMLENSSTYVFPNDSEPYSHSFLLDVFHDPLPYISNFSYFSKGKSYCFKNETLSPIHLLVAKGLTSLAETMGNSPYKHLFQCKNKFSITPHELDLFFNHSLLVNDKINKNYFMRLEFVSLMFKLFLDFKSFAFPKNSVAWKCVGHLHNFRNSLLRKMSCNEKLEDEIHFLFSILRKINKYVYHDLFHFDEILFKVSAKHLINNDVIRHLKRIQAKRSISEMPSDIEMFHILQAHLKNRNCLAKHIVNNTSYNKSRLCLKLFSRLNKLRKQAFFKTKDFLQMLFPIACVIYDKIYAELPVLANQSIVENVKTMLVYFSHLGFHNSPRFKYWDALQSPFNNPFREMRNVILSVNIKDILQWMSPRKQTENVSFLNPFVAYENNLDRL